MEDNSISLFCNEVLDDVQLTQLDPYVPSNAAAIRREKQMKLETEWKRVGCFSEAQNTYKWDYLKKSNWCLENYKEGTIDKDLLINPHHAQWLAYWGVWKKCMERNNISLHKDSGKQDNVYFRNNKNINKK